MTHRPDLRHLRAFCQHIPKHSLNFPVHLGSDWAKVPFLDFVATGNGNWQEKHVFLDVRCEIEQVHYLCDPCTRHVPKPG